MKKRLITLSAIIASTIACTAVANQSNTDHLTPAAFNSLVNQGVPAAALKQGLLAEQWAIKQGDVKNTRYLTLVEFNVPSYKPRLQVIDLKADKVLFDVLVTQGAGSGNRYVPTIFTDRNGSHSSVRGVLVTRNEFYGKHGLSLHLSGIESINKNTASRAIEMHPANYATKEFAQAHGYLGRSWGCFAVSPYISTEIFNVIQGGSVLYAYAPQAGSYHPDDFTPA